jgi:hypothetical protein
MAALTSVSFQDLFSVSTNHFLETFYEMGNANIRTGMDLPFELTEKARDDKISPILQLATPEDAQAIVNIYLDIYQGTYPYKEMESVEEVRQMIENSNYRWLLFKTPRERRIAGCFTYVLDFEKKVGYMRGFNIKREYQGTLDAIKAVIGSMIGIWTEYRNKIKLWYCENRTAHTKSQYLSSVCGIKAIAFLPNKDIFNEKVESDILHIAYEHDTLTDLRSSEIPSIIPEVECLFDFVNERYNLGEKRVKSHFQPLDLRKFISIKRQLQKKSEKDKFGYETITFSLRHSDSYFRFLYTPQANNFEKTEYKVKNKEELFIFLQEWLSYIEEYGVRYTECYVSAYEPDHQNLFRKIGFRPRGYIPSWNFEKENEKENEKFEDSIVFNWYKGALKEPKLLESGQKILSLTDPKAE